MQKVSRTTELIQAASNGNFGPTILNVRPHGPMPLMGITSLHPFMTHSTQVFPAASAIQNLRTMRQQYSSVNTSRINAIQQAINHALRRPHLVPDFNWSPSSHLTSSAVGLYADANVAFSNAARLTSPVINSIDAMSQMMISQARIGSHFNLPLDDDHRLLSGTPPASPTPLLLVDPPTTPAPTLPTTTTMISRRSLPTMEGYDKRSFPIILHRALQELDRLPGGSDAAAFHPDGRSFFITDQQKFADLVLPVFFPKMKGFASFQRQLNLYDFRRVGGMGPDRGSYRHGLFHRDFPSYLVFMKRRKIKRPSRV
ncbi:DNA binding protein [Fragilaria crotonensis]|nr:DNA binding protein [Fragilaria crotonensis]